MARNSSGSDEPEMPGTRGERAVKGNNPDQSLHTSYSRGRECLQDNSSFQRQQTRKNMSWTNHDGSKDDSKHESPGNWSKNSSGIFCRICHDGESGERLISPCQCSGSVALVHRTCIEKWLSTSNHDTCELCHHQYTISRRAKPFKSWLCERSDQDDQRNLLGDFVCFTLLTPLAVISTYLCGSGAMVYMQGEKQSEAIGLICLCVILAIIYLFWLILTIKYHCQVWLHWQDNNQEIRLEEMGRLPTNRTAWRDDAVTGSDIPISRSVSVIDVNERVSVSGVDAEILASHSRHSSRPNYSRRSGDISCSGDNSCSDGISFHLDNETPQIEPQTASHFSPHYMVAELLQSSSRGSAHHNSGQPDLPEAEYLPWDPDRRAPAVWLSPPANTSLGNHLSGGGNAERDISKQSCGREGVRAIGPRLRGGEEVRAVNLRSAEVETVRSTRLPSESVRVLPVGNEACLSISSYRYDDDYLGTEVRLNHDDSLSADLNQSVEVGDTPSLLPLTPTILSDPPLHPGQTLSFVRNDSVVYCEPPPQSFSAKKNILELKLAPMRIPKRNSCSSYDRLGGFKTFRKESTKGTEREEIIPHAEPKIRKEKPPVPDRKSKLSTFLDRNRGRLIPLSGLVGDMRPPCGTPSSQQMSDIL